MLQSVIFIDFMRYIFQDHACALVTLGGEKGILVSGGVGEGEGPVVEPGEGGKAGPGVVTDV